jgi:hypothetical protein
MPPPAARKRPTLAWVRGSSVIMSMKKMKVTTTITLARRKIGTEISTIILSVDAWDI